MSSKPKCPYWGKCYRKNPKHQEEFAHPGDDAAPAGPAKKAPATKPKLDKPTPLSPTTAAAAAHDAMADVPAESVAGKKRGRADTNDSKKAAAPAAAAAASSSSPAAAASSAPANSALDTVFALEDRPIDAATQALWTEFHACCFADSCPVHSSPSSPGSLFTIGAPLLRALYGGLEFASDLYLLLQFAVETYQKQAGAISCDIKFDAEAVKAALAAAPAANGAAAADGADGSSSSSAAAASPAAAAAASSSSASGCAWRAACAQIRRVFVPLLSLELAGPLRILLSEFAAQSPATVHPFLLDRFFYDSPEVWTFLVSTAPGSKEEPSVHYAYYRDDPRAEHPAAFVASLTAESPVVTPVGNSALMALMFAIDAAMDAAGVVRSSGGKKAKAAEGSDAASASSGGLSLESLRADLDAFGKSAGLPLTVKGGKRPVVKRDPAWTKREKKVVCDLDNIVGLVVPYEDDIGWRPVNCENAEITKIVRDIEAAKYGGKKINFDALDHLVTLTAYANDERDPGMGIELALNLFAKSVTNAINSDICRLLTMGYQLVDRNLYSSVIEEFMRHRGKKGSRPVHKWIQKE